MARTDLTTGAPDAELLAALRAGGRARQDAWPVLVRRHSPRMYAVARSFAIDAKAGEDLVQTAWLRLLERIDQPREGGSLGPWLCMIVRNEARKLVTRRRTFASGLDVEPTGGAPDQRPADADLIQRERAAALRYAFAQLEHACRQLLALLVSDPPLSYDEIGAAIGRPHGAIGPTRRRCLERLRRHLPDGFEP